VGESLSRNLEPEAGTGEGENDGTAEVVGEGFFGSGGGRGGVERRMVKSRLMGRGESSAKS
jgi:hypothetical protein